MKPKDVALGRKIEQGLNTFHSQRHPLLGIRSGANRESFLEQIMDSIHRVKYPGVVSSRDISPSRADPSSYLFDPMKAAALRKRQGHFDEAYWLVFIFVHFGKHLRTGWRLARDIYGGLGSSEPWSWERTSSDPRAFREWLAQNEGTLKSDGVPRRFGNHRKYESINAWAPTGTGAAVESYVNWVRPHKTHMRLIEDAREKAGSDPKKVFDHLYHSMPVARFGRTAKFDYLTMIGKLGLASIEPGSTFMEGATGPFTGACLLFGGDVKARFTRVELEARLVQLGGEIGVGMQVLEDALCNWQKSPSQFKRFRG